MAKKEEVRLVANMCFLNEEVFLPEVIPQLQSMCDSVILQDSGSSDASLSIAQALAREEDYVLSFPQKEPYRLDEMRNNMLQHSSIALGDWVLIWDADELPSSGLMNLRDYLRKYAGEYNIFRIPIYHMRTPTHALAIEYGFGHSRAFVKKPETYFAGECHAEIRQRHPKSAMLAPALGMGVIHWSYFCDKRLRRKEQHYANQPTSGHGIGTLTKNLKAGLMEIPPNMHYKASPDWLERIKNS